MYCIYTLPVVPKPPTPGGSPVEDHGAPWWGVVHSQPEVILALLARWQGDSYFKLCGGSSQFKATLHLTVIPTSQKPYIF